MSNPTAQAIKAYFAWYDSLTPFYKKLYGEEYCAVLLRIQEIINKQKEQKE